MNVDIEKSLVGWRRDIGGQGHLRAVGGKIVIHIPAGLEQPGPFGREILEFLGGRVHQHEPARQVVRQPVVKVAVLPVFGDLGRHFGILAAFDLLPHRCEIGLRQRAGQLGNDRGGDNHSRAIGHPLGVGNAIRQLEDLLRLAAVGAHQVEGHGLVVTAPRDKGETRALGAPGGRAIRNAGGGQAPRGAAGDIDQPKTGGALVFLDGPFLHREHGGPAVRRERGAAQALHGPEVLRDDGALVGGEDGDRQRQRKNERDEARGFHRSEILGAPAPGVKDSGDGPQRFSIHSGEEYCSISPLTSSSFNSGHGVSCAVVPSARARAAENRAKKSSQSTGPTPPFSIDP